MASSAGHVQGRNLITAESVVWDTRDYMTTPLKIKAAADKLFTAGINGMIFHGFPYTYKEPGFGTPAWAPFSSPMLPIGTFSSNFNEENPFFKYLPVINAYITRCQYVLRQGQNVADVAMYYPLFGYPQRTLVKEDLTGGVLDDTDAPRGGRLQDMLHGDTDLWPEHEWVISNIKVADHLMANGYNYDHVSESALLDARVCDGMICIGEARYKVLAMNRIGNLPLEVVKKLVSLAGKGAAIVFVDSLPEGQPGLKDFERNDPVIKETIQQLLDSKERVILARCDEVADEMKIKIGIEPDVVFKRPQPNLDYIHRKIAGADYFFFRNSKREVLKARAMFKCDGRVPGIWDAWTGEVKPADGYRKEKGRVVLDIEIGPYGSILLGFDKNGPPGNPSEPYRELVSTIAVNNWHLETEILKPDGKSKPIAIDLEGLAAWREIKGLEGCSTPGRYYAEVNLEKDLLENGSKVMLDLGDVRDAAEVRINGKDVATLLVPPFSCDITGYVKPGENKIEILVTPTLFNRLVRFGNSGDKRYKQFKNRTHLMPSGLIGPASIKAYRGK
jgi:hypothetical protein